MLIFSMSVNEHCERERRVNTFAKLIAVY